MINERAIIKLVRRMITIFMMRYVSVRKLGMGMFGCHELVCPLLKVIDMSLENVALMTLGRMSHLMTLKLLFLNYVEFGN
jgi:hypothetical protein